MAAPFRLYRHDQAQSPDAAGLAAREMPKTLGDHRASARFFQPSPELEAAVNAALAVGAPLLLTGEPGTGKTQVAFHIAHHFGLDLKEDVFPLYVRSNTTHQDLLYEFDAVAYFRAAQHKSTEPLDRGEFVYPGPLWKAYERKSPTVVLIDEIDKAPRDFPNDLLNVLDQHRFHVRERDEWIERGALVPIVVITSNSERRLPEPFLRRCIFHHEVLTEDLVRRAVKARGTAFPGLSIDTVDMAIQRFMELRGTGVRKVPATAELLVWLAILSARGDVTAKALSDARLRALPALAALIKDREDLAQLP